MGSNETNRVRIAAAAFDAANLHDIAGIRLVERQTIGHGESCLVEGDRATLNTVRGRILATTSIAKAERERVAERVQSAIDDLENGEAGEKAERRETLAEKVKKLLEHARSAEEMGSQEEAAAFAAKAEQLLLEHELGMTDVEYAAVREADPLGRTRVDMEAHDEAEPPKDKSLSSSRRRSWMDQLGGAVAEAYFCRRLVLTGSTDVIFIGRESHRQMAEFVFVTLARECLNQTHVAYWRAKRAGEDVRGFDAAFRNEFVRTVARRLKEERKARMDEERAAGNDKALIRLDNAMKAVERFMDEKVPTSKAPGCRGRWSGNGAGREAGRAAGANANIRANGLAAGKAGGPKVIGSGR